jgi:hypothetical protein
MGESQQEREAEEPPGLGTWGTAMGGRHIKKEGPCRARDKPAVEKQRTVGVHSKKRRREVEEGVGRGGGEGKVGEGGEDDKQ